MTLSELKSPAEVATEVIMLRLVHGGSFFLLEGDSDCRFWSPFRHESCEIVNAGSKPAVLGAVQILDQKSARGVLGLVDADLDRLDSRPQLSRNLVVSDVHDLECLLLRSRALERVLAELADPGRLRYLEDEEGCSVREALLRRGLLHGKLRWLAARLGWGPDFGGRLRVSRFVEQATWQVQVEEMLYEAAMQNCPLPHAELGEALDALPPADPWSICRGHDLIDVLRIGLEGRFGRRGQQFGRDALTRALRLAFDRAELGRESTVKEIRAWQNRSRPFKVLAPR